MLGKVPAYLETSVDVPPMSKPITGKSSSLEYEVIAYPTTPPAGPRVWVVLIIGFSSRFYKTFNKTSWFFYSYIFSVKIWHSVKKSSVWNKQF